MDNITLEKRNYATTLLRHNYDGKHKILDYKGNNVFIKTWRYFLRYFYTHRIINDNKVYIANLAVVTSFACNLNCDGCGQHTPILKNMSIAKKKIDMEQVCRDIDKIVASVDGVAGIAVANGEGFLNQNLDKLLDYYISSKKIPYMNIPTNGSVIPSDDTLKKMHDAKVSCSITKYEVIPEKRRQEFISKLDKYNVRYSVFEDRKWFLHEYVPSLQVSPKDAKKKTQQCERYFMLIDGELWKCEVDATRVKAGIRPMREDDCIVVKVSTPEEIRAFVLRKLSLDYLESCLYCRGGSGPDVVSLPAGKQIDRKC